MSKETLENIQNAIVEKQAQWQADLNNITELSLIKQGRLFGFSLKKQEDAAAITFKSINFFKHLAEQIDWRDVEGENGFCKVHYDTASMKYLNFYSPILSELLNYIG